MNITALLEKADCNIAEHQAGILRLQQLTQFVRDNAEKLTKFEAHATIYSHQIDFDYVDRDTCLEIIRTFPGKWEKDFSEDLGKMNYTLTSDSITLRCWGTPPPPSCKLIEEEVEEKIPATEAFTRKVKKFKLDCGATDPSDSELIPSL